MLILLKQGFNNLPNKLDNIFNIFSFIIPNIGFNVFLILFSFK